MESLITLPKYVYSQCAQIQEGGIPVLKRKIRSMVVIMGEYPIIRAFQLVFWLVRYLVKVLLGPHSDLILNKRFVSEFQDLIEQHSKYRADPVNHLLMEAYKAYFNYRRDCKGSVGDVFSLYQKVISIRPKESQAYLGASSCLYYLQGKYKESMAFIEMNEKLKRKQAIEQGLDLLNIKIIGMDWGARMGHLTHIDPLIKLSKLDLLSPEKRVVFVCPELVPNLHYLNYWKRYLDIIYVDNRKYRFLESFCSEIFECLNVFHLKQGFMEFYSASNLAENAWHSENRSPLLELSESDKERGYQLLEQWSIPRDAWFVVIHVRETDRMEGDWSTTAPNSDILTYLPAIKAITSRGGWVIRTGTRGMKPLPSLPHVIDYANMDAKDRTGWIDVFLWASCKFFIGTSSGPMTAPNTFGRPVLYTNACSIGVNVNFKDSLMVPKLFWSKKEKRFFTFREMLDGPMAWNVSRRFPGVDCVLTDNTPEEIEAAVIEMLDNLDKTDAGKPLSILQEKFNSLQREYGDTGQMVISNTFIERHSNLL